MTTYLRKEPDGTLVYTNYLRYKPVPVEQRKYKRHKPDDPRAVRFHDTWYLPLELLPDEERVLPDTHGVDLKITRRARRRNEKKKISDR